VSVRLSVSQSVPSVERAAGLLLRTVRTKDIYRQRRAARPAAAAPRRSAANAGNVMLTAELTRLNTDLGYLLF